MGGEGLEVIGKIRQLLGLGRYNGLVSLIGQGGSMEGGFSVPRRNFQINNSDVLLMDCFSSVLSDIEYFATSFSI